jgi:Heterokaryon incompatibility protein (HET)
MEAGGQNEAVLPFSQEHRRRIPNPSPCVDLSELAAIIRGSSMQTHTSDGLCEVCLKVDLAECFSSVCGDCKSQHYHLGKVEDILLRKECSLCRLISAVHHSASLQRTKYDISTEQCTLVVAPTCDEVKVYFTAGESGWDVQNKAAVHVIRQCIEDCMIEDWKNEAWIFVEDSSSVPTEWRKGRRIGGRRIDSRQVDFDLIRGWLQLCETSHGDKCAHSGLISRIASKIRLIDVLNFQIVDGTTDERYLALSYVWGPGEQLCLSSQNQEEFRSPQGLKTVNTPNTIRDAISLVASIGERYLWVDRLCILMDDERDKLEQMSNMDQIYNSATLTIINADACCCNASIPGVSPNTRPSVQHSEVIRGVRYITTQTDIIPKILLTNWSTRGWTYQEGFLSSRCLVFTDYQAYFQCKSEVWSEDSCSTGNGGRKPKPSIGNALCHLLDRESNMTRCSCYQYMDAVEAVSTRRLTVQTDALWAFTGIMQAFQPQFMDGFTWGLPIKDLDTAILWHPSNYDDGPRKGLHAAIIDSHMIQLPFPTWSWVSWSGGVWFGSKCEEEVKGLVEWHQPARYTVNTAEPFSDPWCQVADNHKPRSSSHIIMDERALGFLHFTTASTTLKLDTIDLDIVSQLDNIPIYKDWILCCIRSPTEKDIGTIQVPKAWFKTLGHKRGNFILLSTQIENNENEACSTVWFEERPGVKVSGQIQHKEDCVHQQMYNVMLVYWKKGPHGNVASRIGITQIRKEDWSELESSPKQIVLG